MKAPCPSQPKQKRILNILSRGNIYVFSILTAITCFSLIAMRNASWTIFITLAVSATLALISYWLVRAYETIRHDIAGLPRQQFIWLVSFLFNALLLALFLWLVVYFAIFADSHPEPLSRTPPSRTEVTIVGLFLLLPSLWQLTATVLSAIALVLAWFQPTIGLTPQPPQNP